jgi:hypothetical protein
MLGHEKKIGYPEAGDVVVHKDQAWVVARRQPFTHCAEGAIDHLRAKSLLLALKLEFFVARDALKVRHFPIAWKLPNAGGP